MAKSGFPEAVDPEQAFRLLADNAPVMIWRSGPDKLCDWFNHPWLEFTGRTMEQELGNGWTEGVHPDDSARCLSIYVAAFDAREEFSMEYRLRRHDGAYRWILDNGRPYSSFDGTFRGYFGSCIDITDSKRAQDALRATQSELARVTRLTTMGELAASIAHEINQPLAAIVANGNAALRWVACATPNLGEVTAALRRIVTDGHRTGQLIGNIRAMLRKNGPEQNPLDVNQLVREVLTLAQSDLENRRVLLQTQLDDDLPQVFADRVQLQQVLLNLIMNAAEAMSSVTDRPRMLRVGTEMDGSRRVLMRVEDSGPGIDSKNIERIFEPFFTTKPHGMGMGLPICRSIIDAHNGHLSASTGVDHGSVFQIVLPIGEPGGG
jgi:PAS domain S-box-containing protein